MAISMLTDPDCIHAWNQNSEVKVQQDHSSGALLVKFALNRLHELYCQNKYIADRIKVRSEISNALRNAAIEHDNPEAKFLWALSLISGFGCEKPDLETGKALILVAAKVYKDPEALNYTALRQYKANPEVAIKLFRLAAEAGNKYAWKSLAVAYMYGTGVEQNYLQALRCLQRAEEVGHSLFVRLKKHLEREVAKQKQLRAETDAIVPRTKLLFT